MTRSRVANPLRVLMGFGGLATLCFRTELSL
jgi:hypothetical protein